MGTLCRFYDVAVTSDMERPESFDSVLTEMNLGDPSIVNTHRDAVMKALAIKIGLSPRKVFALIN